MPDQRKPKGRATIVRAAFLFVFICVVFGSVAALFHPESPVPDEWHPLRPLQISDPVTPLTVWKLTRTRSDPGLCVTAISEGAQIAVLEDKVESENCGIAPRLSVSTVGDASVAGIETACATALTLAMWERHGVQPIAQEMFGTSVQSIRQIGSYNCRRIRSFSGQAQGWSTHARARAIDVTGFDFADGRRLRLLDDWEGSDAEAEFLRAVRDDACKWFGLTLSPDFNALHADHFHLQVDGRGGCR